MRQTRSEEWEASEHTELIKLEPIDEESDDRFSEDEISAVWHFLNGSGELAEKRELRERCSGDERKQEEGRRRKDGKEDAER